MLFDAVLFRDIIGNDFVDIVGRVAIVGRFLRLKLVEEFVILLVSFLPCVAVLVFPLEKFFAASVEPEFLHVKRGNIRQLLRQLLSVPHRKLADLVICEAKRFDLFRRQVIGNHTRHLVQPETLCRFEPRVARDDHARFVDDDGNLEPKGFYAFGNWHNRRLVLARIIRVWFQL